MTAPRTITLPIDHVKPGAENPRQAIDESSEGFLELVASIAELGILQPILVGPKTNGAHPIIAGHRRYAAARKAGLEQLPVLEAPDLAGATLIAALAENVSREDLTPLEEAHAVQRLQSELGYSVEGCAKALGRSEEWVRTRMRILAIPEKAQQALAEGTVPLYGTPALTHVAEASPELADALASAVKSKKLKPADLQPHRLGDAVANLKLPAATKKKACLIEASAARWAPAYSAKDLGRTKSETAELQKLFEAVPDKESEYGTYKTPYRGVEFGDTAIKAARAYGCLLEVESGRGSRLYITDREFAVDQAKQILERKRREREKHNEKIRKKQRASKTAPSGDGSATAESKAQRAAVREQENLERIEAHQRNLELGSRLRQHLPEAPFDLNAAKLLAALVLEHDSHVAGRGRYVDPELIEENWKQSKAQKDAGEKGTLKIEPAGGVDGVPGPSERFVAELDRAKTPEQILGVILRTLIAARLADETVTVQSKRARTDFPGLGTWVGYYGQGETIRALIEEIALGVDGLLPAGVRERLEAERKERKA